MQTSISMTPKVSIIDPQPVGSELGAAVSDRSEEGASSGSSSVTEGVTLCAGAEVVGGVSGEDVVPGRVWGSGSGLVVVIGLV